MGNEKLLIQNLNTKCQSTILLRKRPFFSTDMEYKPFCFQTTLFKCDIIKRGLVKSAQVLHIVLFYLDCA